MKIERFKYHEKFSIKSTFLDTSIDVEGTLDEGETLQEAVAKARKEILKSLPKPDYGGLVPEESTRTFTTPYQSPIPIISKGKEDTEIAIDNAQSLEELALFKESASKYGLVSHYMKRIGDFNKPTNFTEGLE